jgi:septal ring factor EnvC (AmiA/AmiB activator)
MMLPGTENRIAALLEVLDEDIRYLEGTLSCLDTLRSLLIKREEAALEKLLDEVRRQADAHQANERKRQQLRQELAADLGCDARELTLSRLGAALAGPLRFEGQRRSRAAVADRQAQLRSLATRLKREYTLTVLLVRDCTRFNQALLEIFLGSSGRGMATYSPTGAAQRGVEAALMSMKL